MHSCTTTRASKGPDAGKKALSTAVLQLPMPLTTSAEPVLQLGSWLFDALTLGGGCVLAA